MGEVPLYADEVPPERFQSVVRRLSILRLVSLFFVKVLRLQGLLEIKDTHRRRVLQ